MTDALEEQLLAAAATPSHELDAHALIARTRQRRRRLLGGVAAAVVVVLATVGIAAVATGGSGGDDARIAIGARNDGTPEGWTRVRLGQGSSIAVPPGWDQVQFAFLYGTPLGVVGTGAPGVDKDITACVVADTTPTVTGSWVALYELPGMPPNGELTLPGGEQANAQDFVDQPSNFGEAVEFSGGSCGSVAHPAAPAPGTVPPPVGMADADARWAEYLFRVGGRLFMARVVSVDPGQASTELGDRVLDTFRVGDAPWTRVALARGTSIAVPEGWTSVSGAPLPTSLGGVGTAELGSSPLESLCADLPANRGGTWVLLHEVPNPGGGAPITLPDDLSPLQTTQASNFTDRPEHFGTEHPSFGGACGTGDSTDVTDVTDVTWAMYLFRDHGKLFVAEVLDAHAGSASTELGDRVLDTFRAGDDDPTVVTTAPATTTPPPADASPDELAIRDVYTHLIGQVPRDAIGDYVEDYDSIADSYREGIAQNTEETQARYTMRVDSVALTDATHADVRYTLLFDGQPRYVQAGGAVKIDGRWYITRETVCSLLTNGGIKCPARTTPVP